MLPKVNVTTPQVLITLELAEVSFRPLVTAPAVHAEVLALQKLTPKLLITRDVEVSFRPLVTASGRPW
jgi:hypothetical protein